MDIDRTLEPTCDPSGTPGRCSFRPIGWRSTHRVMWCGARFHDDGSANCKTDQRHNNPQHERHRGDTEGAESIAVARFGSSFASSAYVLPPVIPMVCLLITIAWQYAENGPFTSSPAKQSASADTTIFWSDKVLPMTTQATIPATAIMTPTTIAVIPATFRMAYLQSRGGAPVRQAAGLSARATERTAVPDLWCRSGAKGQSFSHCSSTRGKTVDQSSFLAGFTRLAGMAY